MATYFACVNFFLLVFFSLSLFNDRSENNYLGIRWTDFRNLSALGADYRSVPYFPICQETLLWQPNNVG